MDPTTFRMMMSVPNIDGPSTFISSKDFTSVTSATYVIDTPTGAQIGDILLVFIAMTTARTGVTAPGWTIVFNAGPVGTVSGQTRGVCLRLTISGSVPTSTTFTVTGGTSTAVAQMLCFRPSLTASSVIFSTTSQTTIAKTAPTITAPGPGNSIMLACYFMEGYGVFTPPIGFTTDYGNVNDGNRQVRIMQKIVAPGATGTSVGSSTLAGLWNSATLLLT